MIAITGADGLVGRAVCEYLRGANQRILPIVHRKKHITSADAIVIDLSKMNITRNLRNIDVTSLIHLAAAVPHSSYYPDTEESAELTRAIDNNVLSFCKTTKIPAVYMSTCGLYDRSSSIVKFEDDPSVIKIESPYFAAKHEGEALFSNEVFAVIMRLAAPTGFGQRANVVLSRFIMAARANIPIRIWGSGQREQNFIDVRDVSKLVLDAIIDPKACVINVANKQATTMVDLAKTVITTIAQGDVIFTNIVDPKEGETARYSIEKAYKLYKWTPHCTLQDSIKRIAGEEFGET
ncbi:MAG: NAD(P)-dependent oxidoreductase [Syntrophales bacterium LBB04]|nr:NAD(P)-dependent oxidoreductase [Syntrophales bacterium LBB04]